MANELVFDSKLSSEKNLAWWLYLCHGVSLLFSLGALSWIPLIVNYVKRQDAADSFVYSHHNWQIRSFWWYLVWMFVGGALFLTVETGADGSAPAKEKNAYAELLKHRCPARTFHGRRHHLTETQIAYALTQLPK